MQNHISYLLNPLLEKPDVRELLQALGRGADRRVGAGVTANLQGHLI